MKLLWVRVSWCQLPLLVASGPISQMRKSRLSHGTPGGGLTLGRAEAKPTSTSSTQALSPHPVAHLPRSHEHTLSSAPRVSVVMGRLAPMGIVVMPRKLAQQEGRESYGSRGHGSSACGKGSAWPSRPGRQCPCVEGTGTASHAAGGRSRLCAWSAWSPQTRQAPEPLATGDPATRASARHTCMPSCACSNPPNAYLCRNASCYWTEPLPARRCLHGAV